MVHWEKLFEHLMWVWDLCSFYKSLAAGKLKVKMFSVVAEFCYKMC